MNYFVASPGHIAHFDQYESAHVFAKDFGGEVFNVHGLPGVGACSWCGANAKENAARREGPHSTWCVHYRPHAPRLRVFWRRDLGTFWSHIEDLSDLGGPYLKAAKDEMDLRNIGRKTPKLSAVPDTD